MRTSTASKEFAMKKKNMSLTTQMTIAIVLLILLANLILGFFMISQSIITMKAQISERMLDISNTAAATLNGNMLERLQAKDKYTFEYQTIIKKLTVFQDNINLEYIYCIKDMGNKNFVFSIDPSPTNPGEFGSPVAYTDALYAASLGTPSVDDKPYTDEWGTFYSAYSPVYNSNGGIAGIVAVDFSAEWYDSQVRSSVGVVLFSTTLSLIAGGLIVFFVTSRVRKRFNQIDNELNELSDDIDKLTSDLDEYSDIEAPETEAVKPQDDNANAAGDSIYRLGNRIRSTHGELQRYINHMHTREKNMIAALASDYHNVYYVDLETDTGICYRSDPDHDDSIPEGEEFVFSEWFTQYAEKNVTEEYREEFKNLIKPERIREELEKEPVISCQYLAKRDDREIYEMLRIAGIRHPDDHGESTINEISIGITDVDRETRESMNRNRALSDALAVANEASKAKTVFLSNMSHEIRTPMNAIIGLDTIALNDPETSDKSRVFFTKIGVSAKHLLNLINDILDMSRIESGRMTLKKEEFSFSDITEQISTIIGEQCNAKNIRYICNIGENVDKYYIGDEVKLKQIIINILGNAVKFTPEGGEVELSVERLEHFENNTTLRFSMRDTGIGMDKDFIPHIFDAFSQEDTSFTTNLGSTGLGMAITKRIVEMMNGRIEVESEKGVGTTFFVTVTLLDSDRVDTEVKEGEVDINDLCVLVIEPESVSRDCANITMESAGLHADITSSCDQALDNIKRRIHGSKQYNLVVIDRNIPDTDVTEVIKSVRYSVGESAVILMVTDGPDDLTDEETAAGADSVLTMPIYAEDIIEAIKHVHQQRNSADTLSAKTSTLKGKIILVAEDMPVNAEIMAMMLEMREMHIDVAENGRIAVEKFSNHLPGHYAAILMDMRMPEMDGLTATTVIRAMDRPDAAKIPIIALTANAFDEDVQRSLQVGLNAHLSKPVDPDKLFSVLEKMITD